MSKIALLQSVDIFKHLTDEELSALAATVKVRKYRAGRTIFKQGDRGSTMYIVSQGQVNIFVEGNPSPFSIKDFSYSEYFGELALFDEKPRSAYAVAVTNVELLELTREMLSEYITRHPHAAMVILRTLSERLRATSALLSQRASKNVDEEIERHLTWSDRLADKVAELNGSWAFIVILIGITGLWMLLNISNPLWQSFDPYPYVFFNLLLAILVALQGPLIVMSQNRRSLLDRARSEADYNVNLKNEINIELTLKEIRELRQELIEGFEPRELTSEIIALGQKSSSDITLPDRK